MAHTHQYLIYYINLTDKATVDAFQHAGSGEAIGAVLSAPDKLTLQFTAPKLLKTDPFTAPSVTSEWFGTDAQFPTDVDVFERKSGGWFGIPALFGDTITYHWRGIYVYSPVNEAVGGTPTNIAKRFWIDSFAMPAADGFSTLGPDGEAGNDNSENSRMASRHVDGFGWAWRATDKRRSHVPNENGGSLPQTTWERIYIRIRTRPTTQARLWKAKANSDSSAFAIEVMPSGQLAVGYDNSSSFFNLVGTTAVLSSDVVHKIDIRYWFGTPGVGGNPLEIWIDGAVAITIETLPATSDLPNFPGKLHGLSQLGSGAANTLGIDLCDWIAAANPGSVDGLDFQNGSRVVQVHGTGFNAATAGWAGDWRWSMLNPSVDADASTLASSTAGAVLALNTDAGDVVDALPESLGAVAMLVQLELTDGTAADTVAALGPAACSSVTDTNGSNYKHTWFSLVGVPTALKPIAPTVLKFTKLDTTPQTVKRFSATVEVIGAFGPEDLGPTAPSPSVLPANTGPHNAPYPRTPWARLTTAPVQPVFVRSGTYVGNGTAQDLTFPSPIHFLHIRPIGGGLAGGTRWWSTLIAAHAGTGDVMRSNLMIQALLDTSFVPATGETDDQMLQRVVWESFMKTEGEPPTADDYAYWIGPAGVITLDPGAVVAHVLIDYWVQKLLGEGATGPDIPTHGPYAVPPSALLALPDGASFVGDGNAQQQFKLRIVGSNAQSNANAVTYQYLAVGDPGRRFMLNDGLFQSVGAADVVTTLLHAGFAPQAGFFQSERMSGGVGGGWFKGPGGAPSTIVSLQSAGEIANALSWTQAQLTSKNALHAIANCPTLPFSLWRSDDNSGHAGKVCQILSYVGTGGGRTIALLPAVGKYPLYALIVPHAAAAAYYKDAAFTGGNAATIDNGTLSTDAIIGGGLDFLTVGATLNALGVTYDVFAIPGGDTAGADGFSEPGDFWPVPPEPPPGAPTAATGPEPGDPPEDSGDGGSGGPLPDPLAPTGPMPGLSDDLDEDCEPDTRRMINVALSRLGISQQIANVATDATAEASAARLIYNDAIQETLRDYPWPFATRYAQLAQVGSSRPNSDWLYSYRQPSDCLLERRIVVRRTDVGNPDQVPFQLSSDDTGGLIFCNLASAVLEYTARPKCVHTRSEALFRDAAAWKMAEAMGPALTRLPEKVADCKKRYDGAIAQAYVVLRPGNPGEMPGTATIDTSAAAKAANLAVVNLALVAIGAPTILNLATDQTRSAQLVRMIFETQLKATLRDYPWPFASLYFEPPLVAGTANVRLNSDWQYSYRLPADTVFVRRIVTVAGRGYERNPPQFRTAVDATGGLLYTNEETPTIEYTARVEAAVLRADALFQTALAWRLAWMLAPSLAQVVPERPEALGRGPDETKSQDKERPSTGTQTRARAAANARECYYFAIETARVTAANEGQPDIAPVDADWISGRGVGPDIWGPNGERAWRNN